jgi:hypothetical protein
MFRRRQEGPVLKRLGVVFAITMLIILIGATIVFRSWTGQSTANDVARTIILLIGLNILGRLIFGSLHIRPQFANKEREQRLPRRILGFMSRLILGTRRVSLPVGLGVPRGLAPTAQEIAEAYWTTAKSYSPGTLSLLTSMMIDLPHYLERISETVTLDEEVPLLKISTNQIYRFDPRALGAVFADQPVWQTSPPVLIPLAFVKKGTLLDGFSVSDREGHDIITISYNQVRGLLAWVVRAAIETATNDRFSESDRKLIDDATRNLIAAVCAPGPRNKQSEPDQAAIQEQLDSADSLPFDAEKKRQIKRFCELLTDNYVIVAETPLPPGPHLSLVYTQKIPVESSSTHLINRARSRFGLRYATVDITLNPYATRVDTYHMQMDAGPMQYIYDHHLESLTSSDVVTQDDLRSGQLKPYVRLHYDYGSPSMHLYVRRQWDKPKLVPSQGTKPKSMIPLQGGSPESVAMAQSDKPSSPTAIIPLKSVVILREIPPGALGATAVVSFLTATIVTFFALAGIGHGQSSTPSTGPIASDVPALLIALPGVAGLIIGSWLDVSRLRRSSVTTYIGLCASVFLSSASALFFLLDSDKHVPGQIAFSVLKHSQIHTSVTWLVLADLAVTCWLFVTRDVIDTSRYYFHAVKQRVERRANT